MRMVPGYARGDLDGTERARVQKSEAGETVADQRQADTIVVGAGIAGLTAGIVFTAAILLAQPAARSRR